MIRRHYKTSEILKLFPNQEEAKKVNFCQCFRAARVFPVPGKSYHIRNLTGYYYTKYSVDKFMAFMKKNKKELFREVHP